nr:dynein heavy chain 17, axonemal [Vicugna pacos]
MTVTPDVRLEYLEGVASTILKFKPDKWNKMVGVEENMALFTEFFEKPDVSVLVLTLSPAGMVVPCLGFPASLKSKGLYFIKQKPEQVSKDNYRDCLVYGDISPAPVDQLIAVVEEVLYSLFNQSENMSGWPRVVSEDVVKQVHKLKNEMFVMGGKIKGKTLLPIPEHLGSLDSTLESMDRIPSTLDNSLLHAIETIIIDWSHQIRDVLSKDSAQALLDGRHPLPQAEFEFWDSRLRNLKCIHEQLNRPKVNKIVEILEKAKSCYWPALQNVYMNVTEGLKEASDIVLYLKPLQILLEEMEQADFTMLPTFITKVLCTVCFIWATSGHYNTPSRIIVILQEFCNQLIEMTRTYLSPEEVLKGLEGEIEEVLGAISLSVNVLKELYRAYDFCCANMKLFFKRDKEPVPWEFPSSLAFSRINTFFHRVQTIEDLYKTAIEFLKLEKIEIGGVRGNILGSRVTQLCEEVFELVKVFADCRYDPLDPGDSSFDDDYADFETKIQDLDRRLATIFCQGFDDCSSIESCAKLLYMCGGLLERPLILAEVVPRYSVMLELFDAELDNTKILYDTQIAASADRNIPPIHKNMPPVAGQLKWSLELQERLEGPMRDLKHIEHPVMSSVEAKLIYQKYDEMMELLRSYRERIYQQWVAGVDQDCHFNLGQPLIQRDPVTGLIRVNFSKALVAVLREVKYLNFQQQKEIPSSAENLYSQYETFRKFVGNLELIVGWYDEIKTTMMDVEFPLIKSELEAIDVKLLDAETTLYWNGDGVFEYIQEMREILHNLQNRIQKAKRNVEGVSQAMKDWSANPMFERKDNKKEALLDLDGRVTNLTKRYTAVKDAGLKIQAMVAENADLFRADVTSQSWKDYVSYIDSMVLEEFECFIRKSLNYLMDSMVVDESVAPLFEVHMELEEDGLVFSPSLEVSGDYGFLELIGSLVTDIYNVAKLIPRLAKGRMSYKTDLEDMTDLIEMREEISSLVITAMKEAEEYQDSFERYSYLWMDDPQEFMKNFLTYGRAISPEDLDTRAEETLPKTPPTLTQFQQQIDSYEKLYEAVSRCGNTKVFSGWLQCDCRPFKQALLNTIKRWSFMFKRHLSNHVVNSLADLEAFMKVARAGLTKPVKEGDYDGLVEVMGHLMKVKERQTATDNMFEPLKQTIELLKSYGEEMPEEVHMKLQELPEQWTNTKKLAIQVKQNVAPLQANEVSILRRKCQQFELKQHEFREKFRQEAPFSFSDPDPYKSLNKQQKSIVAMEGIMEALCKSGSLFEVTVPDYKQLKACHKEVRLLKELWDMIIMVNTSIDGWKTTKWRDINVEQMDIDCKKFAKDVRSLDKEMKSWDAFVGLDNTVKNMITSLRAVSELQNPATRDRHWQQLMQATQVKFEMSEETTLADLLRLNLHRYEDEVRNIVDKAVKESGMEKVLKALDSTWSAMEFEHEPHPRTGTMMLKSDEVLVETLEDNQVQLQNLMTSKYLSHFLQEVTSWQQKLSTADSVISIWFEVQRTWSHLESIFIGSEDIRTQLPEDSRRFDDIDLEFKALMEDAVKTPNVIEATNKPGLYNKLETLKKSLAVCEKALAEYLETKRLAFPRFYFVSSADLLDILSNGNDPVEVGGPPTFRKQADFSWMESTPALSSAAQGYCSLGRTLRDPPDTLVATPLPSLGILEKPLEKKSGRNYGPPGTKKLIYFIDDMNMPEVDKYGTVAPHTLIRQHMDHGHWYDRQKLTLKDVHNCQYVACMNPTSGSFTIDPRLQRHFCVFAVSFPGQEALMTIYSTILTQHLVCRSVPMAVQRMSGQLVASALALHQKVTSTFLPTAIKFHYVFNLRDLSNIFQGLLFSSAEILKIPLDLVRLWLHEAERVYGDKMVDEKDQTTLLRVTMASTKKFFDDLGEELLFARPNIYCHFAQGIGDPKYLSVTDVAQLNKLLMDVLDSYNEVNAVMNLVLFEDAVAHICRINRILEAPRGNALLVGVGGSGKQSLSRLAAYISALDVFQITLKKGYGIPDLKLDLGAQYIKSAVKNVPSVFLMTDSQVAEEQFLVLINDLLASGEIPGLFGDEELENIISSMRPQVKSLGLTDTREACWKFFIDKVRKHLKVILCFSPVGSVLRVRARKFPAVVNCTAIDWFHEWPEDALVSVSARFLEDTEGIQPEVKASISLFMSHVHTTVNEMSKVYLATERRYNYTTPKTFLEQIKLYQSLLAKKRMELVAKIERLENGLMKLQSTASQVDDLKAKLAVQEAELKQKNENADKLIHVVGVETEKVSKEKAIADEEEVKVEVINKNVTEKQKACETDLAKAEPALLAAQEALDTLNKNNLTELKSFGSPPDAVVNVTAAVMILTAPGGKIPKDKSWKAAKIMMGKVDTFLDSLKKFDKEHIPEACLKAFKPYQGNPTFDPEFVRSKSTAAAGLCSWCINIVRFYEVYCDVAPKRQALEEANAELAEAQEKLSRVKNKIAELNANLSNLTSAFEKATAEKIKCQQEADSTNRVISLANRLVGGLASENVRWAESVENYKGQGVTLCGDVLLISAFVSYVGYFTKKYRNELMERFWIPYINQLKVPIPTTEGLDPLSLLTDDADVATWNNQGLPSDRMSTENATILCNTERWPLVVDAQLQGIKWIKNKYGSELKVIRLGQKSYLDIIEQAVSEGGTLLIENIGETVDPVLDPLLGRNTIKKGKFIKIGDKEVEYHPKFRLILHTKYFNPHYKPEMQAQCTLINFLVTRDGLEDQLLAAVVAKERPDLEQLKANLTKSQNEFKIVLKALEDSLLARLSAASGSFLGDTALVENLETTKHTASEIEEKVQEAKITEVKINEARESYRPAAERASLLYFILSDLNKINPIYQFSLKVRPRPGREPAVRKRVINLMDEITYSAYMYTARGLFERDKLIFLAQVAFQVLSMKKELNPVELDFLLRFPFKAGVVSPVDFLQNQAWGGIKALAEMDEFKNLDSDIEGSAKRWKKLVESEAPEKEIFPKEWKNKTALQKLCMVRCMRPDRMTYAIKNFVEEKMGSKFVEGRSIEFSKSYEESSPSTPIFFILSPGVDPLKDVEALGKKLGFTIDNGKLHNVSLGQGQEVVAENALDVAAEKGHWVILQNIHLVARWLSTLDKRLERFSTGSHHDYRVLISAEPAPSPEAHIIPQGILENAIKITNEPPTGMYANLHKALDLFTQDTLETCTKEIEFKCILFALCYFHAVVAERRKFGAQGWNRSYPFNNGDLTISISVLYNYLEANAKVPWDDLRYLFGEIMYGGHITDDWDRRLCRTYLAEYVRAEMLEGEILLAPGFQIPPNLDYKGYHEYIDENLPPESPYLYGLHPNAEIGFLTVTSEKLFRTVLEMQPKETDTGAGTGVSREEKVKAVLDEILEKIPETFNMAEIMAKASEKTPYVVVAFQECERMNILTNEMRRSLKELNLGLKGELTITTDMEDLSTALFYDTVPDTWMARAYPSMMGLAAWYADLLLRIRELEAWTTDFALPTTVWLAGFFNPQSFLTAIMQSMARKNEWPLDKMCLSVEVTKKSREDMTAPPREGSYVYGLFMEGARWDTQTGVIAEARLKELTPAMPVIFIKAIPVDRTETKNIYECPVYKTRIRGPTYVWTFNLKTKEKAAKWILAAVALLLQV